MLFRSPLSITKWYKATDEENKCIVYVHGIDMDVHEYHSYSESAFKRLWWQGYRGRFCALRWATLLSPRSLSEWNGGISIYNTSEMRASILGPSLTKYVNALKTEMPNAKMGVMGHSLGNMLVGSAFQHGLNVDNYVALQAAVPLACYFPPAVSGQPDPLQNSFLSELTIEETGHPTPDSYVDRGYRGGVTVG